MMILEVFVSCRSEVEQNGKSTIDKKDSNYVIGEINLKKDTQDLSTQENEIDALSSSAFQKERSGDKYGALKDYSKLISRYPENPFWYLQRALLYHYGFKDFQSAIVDYTKTIKYTKNRDSTYYEKTTAFYKRGEAKYMIEDYRGALKDFYEYENLRLESKSSSPELFGYIGKCKYNLNLFESALISLDLSLAIYEHGMPYNGEYKYYETIIYHGLTNIALGKKDEGCEDLSRASELGHWDAARLIKIHCR